ncbi:hypothetical protein [Halosolutus gelatinilyticus]|uniref:hypothetical protein n=1 Tax=Halosolutus gelatinilyticus TaxID=2931975 RepID=UPI001FF0F9F1|nr:hypothetical protein [Halosolutus gelatinilyticus]
MDPPRGAIDSIDGRADRTTPITAPGWAYAPELVTMSLSYLAARREIATWSFDGSDPATLQRQLEAVQQSVGPASFVILLVTVA